MPATEIAGPAFAADRARYSAMGCSVCVTAAFSLVALTSALSLATGGFNPAYPVVGLVWALFIFNMDRWVVSAVDYGTGWRRTVREIKLTAIRLVVASMIGLSISIPLEMLLFQTEIGVQVQKMHDADANAAIAAVRQDITYDPAKTVEAAELATARAAADQTQHAVDKANIALDLELNGAGGSRYPGVGDRSRERQRDLDAADRAREEAVSVLAGAQTRYDNRAAQLKATLTATEDQIRRESAGRPTGLIDRAKALAALADDRTVAFVAWLVRGLILLVDVSPVLLKVVSPPTLYDRIRPEHAARAEEVETSTIKANAEFSQVQLRIRQSGKLVRLARSEQLKNERNAYESDIDIRQVRKEHKARIRAEELANPSHPLVKPLSTPPTGNPRLRVVSDKWYGGTSTRRGRHVAGKEGDAGW